MKNKLMISFIVSMLVLNFVAWIYVTTYTQEKTDQLLTTVEKCINNG